MGLQHNWFNNDDDGDQWVCDLETDCLCSPTMRPSCEFAYCKPGRKLSGALILDYEKLTPGSDFQNDENITLSSSDRIPIGIFALLAIVSLSTLAFIWIYIDSLRAWINKII